MEPLLLGTAAVRPGRSAWDIIGVAAGIVLQTSAVSSGEKYFAVGTMGWECGGCGSCVG